MDKLAEQTHEELCNEMDYVMNVWSLKGYVDDLPGVLELERELVRREELA